MQHAVANTESFAAIHAIGNYAEVWELRSHTFGYSSGAIRGTVVNEKNFRFAPGIFDIGGNFRQGFGQA